MQSILILVDIVVALVTLLNIIQTRVTILQSPLVLLYHQHFIPVIQRNTFLATVLNVSVDDRREYSRLFHSSVYCLSNGL